MGIVALDGILLMAFAQSGKAKAVGGWKVTGQPGLTAEVLKALRWQPLTELLLGFVFTFAGLFFARRVFGGEYAWHLCFAIAGVITALSSWGAYTRFRPVWREAEVEEELRAKVSRLHLRFCLGMWLVLITSLVQFFLFVWQ